MALAEFFGRNSSKLIGALAIPAVIIAFWFYAQNEANQQVQEFDKAQKIRPNTDETTITNYELKEVDDSNQVRWLLAAKTGALEPVSHDVNLKEVHVDYMDGKTLKMRISAPIGQTNEVTRLVTLAGIGDNRVSACGEEGKVKLEAAKVELDKKNQFQATGNVNIVWSNAARVIGDTAFGALGSKGSNDLSNVKLIGHTHALIGSVQE
jgi:hypothetical protein